MKDDYIIFAGMANPQLAASIALELGVELGDCVIDRFPDGEISVRIDVPVRGREIFILQSTMPPVNEHLVELLILADACRRASAAHITAIVPYFGYARSDKRHGRREPITASMVADLMQAVGIDHIVTIDLHAPQIEGFFHIPVDSLTAAPILARAVALRHPDAAVIVSPDAGRVKMATEYAHLLNVPVVVLHKRRESGTETEVTHVVGDVRDRLCLIIDDMISTGGTVAESVEALRAAGAREKIIVAATHGLLLAGARDRLTRAGVSEVWVTDTVAVTEKDWPQLRLVSVAPLLSAALRRFLADGSLSKLGRD
jgi:ribose-phosphate pyrophosphokinase